MLPGLTHAKTVREVDVVANLREHFGYNCKNNCDTLFFAGGETFFIQNEQKLDNFMPKAGQKIRFLSKLINWPVQVPSFQNDWSRDCQVACLLT